MSAGISCFTKWHCLLSADKIINWSCFASPHDGHRITLSDVDVLWDFKISRTPRPSSECQASCQISGLLAYISVTIFQTKKQRHGLFQKVIKTHTAVKCKALWLYLLNFHLQIPWFQWQRSPWYNSNSQTHNLTLFHVLSPLTKNLFNEVYISLLPSIISKLYSKVAFFRGPVFWSPNTTWHTFFLSLPPSFIFLHCNTLPKLYSLLLIFVFLHQNVSNMRSWHCSLCPLWYP